LTSSGSVTPAPDTDTPAPDTGAPAASPTDAAADDGPFPSRDELTLAWGDHVLGQLSRRAAVRFQVGRFLAAEGDAAVYALPNSVHRDRCEEARLEVEQALSGHFRRRIRLRLVVDGEPMVRPAGGVDVAPPPEVPEDDVDMTDLRDAPPGALASPLDHVMQAFEGAQVVEE